MKGTPLLEVSDLCVSFRTQRGVHRVVHDLSFTLFPGETLAIVGESGCGKTTAAMSILDLIPSPPGQIDRGAILYQGRDLRRCTPDELRAVRGRDIAMIFQDPMMAFNPVKTIGWQISEALVTHTRRSSKEAFEKAIELLHQVGIPAAAERARQYPHNLSGGMRQRAMIAMALSCAPKVLIADEPTTALDVTIQAQILDLLLRLKESLGMAIVLITHDLGVVSEVADRVLVMYAGMKVEEGSADQVFDTPRHPYTKGLLAAADFKSTGSRMLMEIPGTVPSPSVVFRGCPFAPRCREVLPVCHDRLAGFKAGSAGHGVDCHAAESADV